MGNNRREAYVPYPLKPGNCGYTANTGFEHRTVKFSKTHAHNSGSNGARRWVDRPSEFNLTMPLTHEHIIDVE